MGQYWNLFNVENRERLGDGKLGEIFFESCWHRLVKLLAQPTRSGFRRHTTWLAPGTSHAPPSKAELGVLSKLPDEILTAIFASFKRHHIHDMIMFSLAHSYLAEIGYFFIQKIYQRKSGSWSNDRLICAGDYAHTAPNGVFTEDEMKMVRESGLYWYLHGEFKSRTMSVKTFYFNYYVGFPPPQIVRSVCSSMDVLHAKENQKLCQYVYDLCTPRLEYDSTKDWVLANLTKSEYIRADALNRLPMQPGEKKAREGPFLTVRGIGLGHVLLSRVCYSDDPSVSMPVPWGLSYNIIRGPWAGHRFEITTLDRLKPAEKGEWKDISVEAMEDMRQIIEEFEF
ncbi:hypothetical protein K474DRAFT_1177561 [Panus rudis PR-1116 ss-1]|nr:hypothetical protein K474DRAFT_1177561 [Panus rudis PR-1116 ss-1]